MAWFKVDDKLLSPVKAPLTRHLDGCPSCMARDNAPTTTQRVPSGIQCTYECRDCGQDWITSWWEADD